MANKPTKPIKVVPPATPTKEELEMKRLAYFAQRREQIAVNILCNIVQSEIDNLISNSDAPSAIVKMAVKMTDTLLEQLYPKPEDKK